MVKCRRCGIDFIPKEAEATRLYHSNRAGFCSVVCDKQNGIFYDVNVTHPGAFARHRNPDRISTQD
jgi:hypothetical protein